MSFIGSDNHRRSNMESVTSYAEMVNDSGFQQAKNNEAAIRNQAEITFEAAQHIKQTSTDKSTVMSNVKGQRVINNNAKEVVISVKNQPNTSYAETENRSSAQ